MKNVRQYIIGFALLVSMTLSACSAITGGTQLPPVGSASSTPAATQQPTNTPVAGSTITVNSTAFVVTPAATQTPWVQTQVVIVTAVPKNTVAPTGTPAATSTLVPAAPLANSAQVSVTQTVSGTSNMADAANCPTRADVNDQLFGVNPDGSHKDIVVQVSTESGSWQVNTGSVKFTYPITLTGTKLIATIHDPAKDLAEVWNADGSKHTIFRGTFRYAGCYSPDDDMNQPDAAVRILVKENTNGTFQDWFNNRRLQNWQFRVLPGNFKCPAGLCPTANYSNNSAAARTTAVPASCPTFGGVATVGGNDGSPFCKYSGAVMTDKVAAGWKAEYWDGTKVVYANSGDSITTGDATFRPAVQ